MKINDDLSVAHDRLIDVYRLWKLRPGRCVCCTRSYRSIRVNYAVDEKLFNFVKSTCRISFLTFPSIHVKFATSNNKLIVHCEKYACNIWLQLAACCNVSPFLATISLSAHMATRTFNTYVFVLLRYFYKLEECMFLLFIIEKKK